MAQSREEYLLEQFKAIANRYEISDYFAKKLRQLEGFEIVLVLDDSGSMNSPLNNQAGGAFAKAVTRWEELKNTVGIIVDIAAVMDKDGVDLYFLNRATMLGVSSSSQLAEVFAAPPAGLTPLTPVVQHIFAAKKAISAEKKVLVVVLTDGQPTNPQGEVDIPALRHVIAHERNSERVFVTFVACTDDNSSVAYLNKWDKELPHCDVVDDYVSERAEIHKRKGADFPFSVGNYIVKALLGSIDPDFDTLDEKQQTEPCCSVQ